MLAAVTALVFPVVRRGMDHTEVRRGGVIEQLRDGVVRVGIRVQRPVGIGVGALVDERSELLGRLIGERVHTLTADALVCRCTGVGEIAAEGHGSVMGASFVVIAVRNQHHVHDLFEIRVEQDLHCGFGIGNEFGRDLVAGSRLRHAGKRTD